MAIADRRGEKCFKHRKLPQPAAVGRRRAGAAPQADRAGQARACARVEGEQDQDHHPLDHLHQHRRHALGALHRLRTVVERAEQQRGTQQSERVETREQRDRDRLVTPSGREFLVQPMGDRGDLDRAAQAGQRAAQRHHQHREPRDRDSEERARAAIDPVARNSKPMPVRKSRALRSRARAPRRESSRS